MAQAASEKDTGCVHMFQQSQNDQLKLLFEVFKRDPSTFNHIINAMQPYIKSCGEAIVNDNEALKDPNDFTQKLLKLKADVDYMIAYAFENNMQFQKARDQTFTLFMNEQDMTPGYIAKHTHENLTKNFKGKDEGAVTAALEAIIGLFRLLHGRDAFIKQAEKLLADRLLNKLSISQEHEEMLLQKLKVECGSQQLNKMSQMITDMTLSQEINQEYRQHIQNSHQQSAIQELNISVLQGGTWPNMDDKAARLP